MNVLQKGIKVFDYHENIEDIAENLIKDFMEKRKKFPDLATGIMIKTPGPLIL